MSTDGSQTPPRSRNRGGTCSGGGRRLAETAPEKGFSGERAAYTHEVARRIASGTYNVEYRLVALAMVREAAFGFIA